MLHSITTNNYKMKKAIGLLAALAVFSCEPKEEVGFEISGTLKGFDDGETLYVNQVSNSGRMAPIDSTTIKGEKFNISLPKVASSDYSILSFGSTRGNILLLSENAKIEIEAEKGKLEDRTVKGGEQNQIFTTFYESVKGIAKQQESLAKQNQEAVKSANYQEQVRLAKLNDSLQQIQKDIRLKYAKNEPQSLVNVMAIAELMNMNVLKPKELNSFYEALDANIRESRLGKLVGDNLETAISSSTEIGDEVADFFGPNTEGEPTYLKKNLGKLTLLDFWASWCKPCRYENPNVVRVYNKYHDKGLEIISISLDRDKAKWIKAIEDDKMNWKHISNLKFWQEPIAKKFGVRSIPATFLLDENGVIIAKNLRGQALEDKIAELLK